MDLTSNIFTVAIVSFFAVMSPGPDFFLVIKNSLTYSRKIGFWTSLGICLAVTIHIAYTLIGIGVLISEGTLFYLLMKYVGAAYLFYIGCRSFLDSFKKQRSIECIHSEKSVAPLTAVKQGFLTNLLNPKCALFFVSLFSQFITKSTPLAIKLSYAGVNWIINLAWFLFLSYMVTAKFITSRLNNFQIYVERVMGVVIMLVSLKLILS